MGTHSPYVATGVLRGHITTAMWKLHNIPCSVVYLCIVVIQKGSQYEYCTCNWSRISSDLDCVEVNFRCDSFCCGVDHYRGGGSHGHEAFLKQGLRTVAATRYVMPLREGGSLPGLVEASDDGMYVVKFRGAGQGSGALVAELVVGEFARLCALPVPELVFIDIDTVLARSEPDDEVQALIVASAGLNLACDFLPGALPFDAALLHRVDPMLASAIVWFDAMMTNIDRTARNTNMLWWHRKLHVIDHGAALYVMHAWDGYEERIVSPFSAIRNHVLLPIANDIEAADTQLSQRFTPEAIATVLEMVPNEWWPLGRRWQEPAQARAALQDYLVRRIAAPRAFVAEVLRARSLI